MALMRNIKRRIRSVGSTQQITKAMNLVAASKLQRAKNRLESARPFAEETMRVMTHIVGSSKGLSHPLLNERPVQNTAIILISGDRGLCGGYNTNISKEALRLWESLPNPRLIVVGSKGRDYFRRRKKKAVRAYTGISEKPFYEDAAEIGHYTLDLFQSREVDEVYLVYTQFNSTISHTPTVKKLLPVDTEPLQTGVTEDKPRDLAVMNYEPDEETVLGQVIPKYINTVIYGALTAASTCEQAAAMTSMDAATKNAEEMIDKLTLQYNRARQGSITQELTEIVAGANVLGF